MAQTYNKLHYNAAPIELWEKAEMPEQRVRIQS